MRNDTKLDILVQTVGRLIRRGALANLKNIYDKARPVEVAHILSNLPRPERRNSFRILFEKDVHKAAEALTELSTEVAVALLREMEVTEIERLLREMSPDDTALFIDALPEELRDELLSKMKGEDKADVQELLSFPSETAGRIMTPNIFALEEDVSVGEAISALQSRSAELEMVFYLYIVDKRNHLVGVVSLRELLQHPPSMVLRDFMSTDVISVRTHTDQEEVARQVANYNLLAIPVVDDENKLAGIVTVDDVIDVIREEATEDIFALAGVDAADRALGIPMNSFRRRLPWLIASLFTAFLISFFVIRPFDAFLKEEITLAIILPLVAAMGGHAATQTLTVVVRGISTGEVNDGTKRRAFVKEILVGLLNGIVLGLLAAVLMIIFFKKFYLGLVVLGSLIVLMFVAALIGTLVPMTLRRLDFDPAIASSIFVITITDVLGFFTFLGLSVLFIKWLGPA